jgi:cytochrome P450
MARSAAASSPGGAAGVTIPRGARVILLFVAGSRYPVRFPDADRFIPDRPDNEHLGFCGIR